LRSTAWIGLLWFVIVVGNGIAIIRRRRRSGDVQSYGHPKEDFLLLITSALVMIAAMFAAFWFLGSRVPVRGSVGSYFLILLLLLFAAGLTVAFSKLLRKKPKRRT